uniref:3'-5' exonuclease domain-containing protein n=1 Tax=Glossina palpalis gambiensis TaxID=67801 RepID=A0A1B0BNC1_9MUSC
MAKTSEDLVVNIVVGLITLVVAAFFAIVLFKIIKKIFNYLTQSKCDDMVAKLKSHCRKYKVLGFDCEWVTVKGERRPVALVQLCSTEAFCVLFRLNRMLWIPESLTTLLEDEDIMKVSVDAILKAKKLAADYDIKVAGAFDLRYLARMTRRNPENLEQMTSSVLHAQFDNSSWSLAPNWEAKQLYSDQIEDAANRAYAAVEIFKSLAFELDPSDPYMHPNGNLSIGVFRNNFSRLLDHHFHEMQPVCYSSLLDRFEVHCPSDQCLLLAPDDEFVCEVDKSKGEWYLKEHLGTKVDCENFTVRVKHFPRIQTIGYYQRSNETRCHICGGTDAFVHKPVVPQEYSKHFRVKHQLFIARDVIFLCPKCVRLSAISDLKMYNKLRKMCGAPYSYFQRRRVKKAATMLLNEEEQMSEESRQHYEAFVSDYYTNYVNKKVKIDRRILKEISEEDPTCYLRAHGQAVVQKFEYEFGGLLELTRLWRTHFGEQTDKASYIQASLLWSKGRSRNPVALLQLASPNGFCGLFRLCHMHHIPQSLKNLLVDKEIIKVGVDPAGDAQKLQEDKGIYVTSTFDIRYLAVMLRCKPLGLEKLSRSLLNVGLVKQWDIAKSNWEFDMLDRDQVQYAANDAFAGIEIFKHLANRLKPRNYWNFTNADFMAIMSEIQYLLDRGFSKDTPITLSQDIPIRRLQFCPLVSVHYCYNLALLSHKDYLLEAPNGRPLCVVSKSKGKWYLQERLGEKIKSEAFTIRLYNQPFAEENGYWLTSNQHECVVCGQKGAFVSKDVVPSEYRIHFPLITQFFTSSDVLHLCLKCYDLYIISDIKIRTALSRRCGAPYSLYQIVVRVGIGLGLAYLFVKFQNYLERCDHDKACDNIVNTLRKHCGDYKVLGFDCEWVSVGRSRKPVALLQLASSNGFCGLFHLCHMHHIPKSLKNLLEDKEIIKVGIDPSGDAQKLQEGYVASTFDIRYLAVMIG